MLCVLLMLRDSRLRSNTSLSYHQAHVSQREGKVFFFVQKFAFFRFSINLTRRRGFELRPWLK